MAHADDASAGESAGQAGERIAKVLARAGVASRRDVERLIAAGRVAVNGETLTTPGVKVSARDRVTLDGRPVAAAEPTRLFRYHKPPGLVTTHRDPQGRPTVFAALPAGLPRLISVGRLDLNSEGLLLLTNDGELARRLELPATGLKRRYRARARGRVDPAALAALKDGITVADVRYGPIEAEFEPGHEDTGANRWIRLTLAEGKNREVRRVLEALGLTVNRLIRVAYGPYELGDLAPGEVQELPAPTRGGAGGGAPHTKGRRFPARKAITPTTERPEAPPSRPIKETGRKGWAKAKPRPKIKRPRSGPAAATDGPRGPKPPAPVGRTKGGRPGGPGPGGGPRRRG